MSSEQRDRKVATATRTAYNPAWQTASSKLNQMFASAPRPALLAWRDACAGLCVAMAAKSVKNTVPVLLNVVGINQSCSFVQQGKASYETMLPTLQSRFRATWLLYIAACPRAVHGMPRSLCWWQSLALACQALGGRVVGGWVAGFEPGALRRRRADMTCHHDGVLQALALMTGQCRQ